MTVSRCTACRGNGRALRLQPRAACGCFSCNLPSERPHSQVTADAPITSMDHVVVSTSDPERAAALYGARLGLDMALDRSHPEWGRLMFFRCGDLIVEVAHRPGKDVRADRQAARHQLAHRQCRRDTGAPSGCRPRRVGGAHRTQARHARHDGEERHLRRADAAVGEDGEAGVTAAGCAGPRRPSRRSSPSRLPRCMISQIPARVLHLAHPAPPSEPLGQGKASSEMAA